MTLSLSMFVDRIIICRHKHGDMQFSRNGKKERKNVVMKKSKLIETNWMESFESP